MKTREHVTFLVHLGNNKVSGPRNPKLTLSYPNALTFINKLGVHQQQIRQLAELF